MNPRSGSKTVWFAVLAIVLVVAGVFVNGVGGAFVFDDESTIQANRSIRDFSDVGAVFSPPVDATTVGRPLANATLAMNYAVSGLMPWSYHVFNISIQILAALALFGVVRRGLRLAKYGEGVEEGIALCVAVLWAVHPLQTESVTYVVQRVEALAGLFYLLTVYCFLRSVEPEHGAWRWQVGAVATCWLGAGCKEIGVSAPLFVLLCDRTWVAGTFGEALRRRKGMYAGLALTWVLLAMLVLGSANRSGTAGFGTGSAWLYLLTQCGAILIYLKQVVWPVSLVFDYGNELVDGLAEVWPQAAVLCAVAGGTVFAIVRRSSWGVAGFWFFAILAPSSSVVPVVTQTMAEHRMYLPLAAAVVAGVVLGFRWLGRRVLYVGVALAIIWGGLTVRRNADYATKATIWADTVEKRPENWRAWNNLGLALAGEGRQAEALAAFDAALAIVPGTIEIRNNRVPTLVALGRVAEGLTEIEAVLALAPQVAEFIDTKGLVLVALDRGTEAAACFREAVRLKPELDEAQMHLEDVLRGQNKTAL